MRDNLRIRLEGDVRETVRAEMCMGVHDHFTGQDSPRWTRSRTVSSGGMQVHPREQLAQIAASDSQAILGADIGIP